MMLKNLGYNVNWSSQKIFIGSQKNISTIIDWICIKSKVIKVFLDELSSNYLEEDVVPVLWLNEV
jgi:hypothetical protein